jgi:hypothetical protein
MPPISSTSGRLHSEFVRLLFLQTHRETDRFFAASGVQLVEPNSGLFHFRRAAFFANLKSKIGNLLAKVATLRINLNLDGSPIASKSHTHPSHSQTSRLLTSRTIGKVQCLHQGITPTMTRILPADTLLTNKSQPFSIVWTDNTDSICDQKHS